jgi:thiol-disulfide isomerase/thioredoxin
MTTGSWFVLFKAAQCVHCAKVKPIFDLLAEDEEISEKGIVLATMDVPSNRRTSTRFDIRGFPVMFYFHRGQMYKYRGKRSLEAFKKFILEDVDTMLGGPIPAPLSSWEVTLREMTTAMKDFYDFSVGRGGVVGMAVSVLTVMFFLLLATLVAMCFLPSSATKDDKED